MASAEESSPVVLVTGASGYVGSHVVQQLQAEGYRVRGTVRSLDNESKVKPLYELCPEARRKLVLVEADLLKPETWDSAVNGCTYVMHVASPFPSSIPREEDDLIKPAVEGTLSVLRSCHKARVKRVVLTSSLIAVFDGKLEAKDREKFFTEEDWTDLQKASAYGKSKTLAERAAWDFIHELPEGEKFELAVINPGYIIGPLVHNSPCTSMEMFQRLLEHKMPAVPKLSFNMCDVRDVATAHLRAMTLPEAAGHRHIIVSKADWVKHIAEILDKEFKPQGYNVPTMQSPYALVWMMSLIDKAVKMILPMIGEMIKVDTTRFTKVLGMTPRDIDVSIVEMGYSLIERGFVKKTSKYRPPEEKGVKPSGDGRQ